MENPVKIKKYENREGGFVELIVLILVGLLVMKYYGITISEAVNWFKAYFGDVLR